jgi:hypothetical protein
VVGVLKLEESGLTVKAAGCPAGMTTKRAGCGQLADVVIRWLDPGLIR